MAKGILRLLPLKTNKFPIVCYRNHNRGEWLMAAAEMGRLHMIYEMMSRRAAQ